MQSTTPSLDRNVLFTFAGHYARRPLPPCQGESAAVCRTILRTVVLAAFAVLPQLVVVPPCPANWWSEGNLLQRTNQWLAEAPSDPEQAAQRLAELAVPSQDQAEARVQSIFALLAADARFPNCLRSVLSTGGHGIRINSLLVQAGAPATPALLQLLTDRQGTPASVRARCADALQARNAPEFRRTLVDCLLEDDDARVQAICAQAARDVAWTPPLEDALLARVRSPQIGTEARLTLIEVFGKAASDRATKFLIEEVTTVFVARPPPEADYRTAVLEASAQAALSLRRRAPQGPVALDVLKAAEQLWERRENEAGPEAATICLIWVRLAPDRFRDRMSRRLQDPAFWLETVEKKGLRTWCQAVAENCPWPEEERRRTVEILVAVGQALQGHPRQQDEIGVELTRSFQEWPITIAIRALASESPDDRRAACQVLSAVGSDSPPAEGVKALQKLAFPTSPIVLQRALRDAGQAVSAQEKAAQQLIRALDQHQELLRCLDASSEVIRKTVAKHLLEKGNDDVLWEMGGIAPPPYRNRARKVLAEHGYVEPALEWAIDAPHRFLEELLDLLNRGTLEQCAGSANLLVRLADQKETTAPVDHIKRLFPKGQLDAGLLQSAWDALRKIAVPRRNEVYQALQAVLLAPPAERGDIVADCLETNDHQHWRSLLDDYRRRAREQARND